MRPMKAPLKAPLNEPLNAPHQSPPQSACVIKAGRSEQAPIEKKGVWQEGAEVKDRSLTSCSFVKERSVTSVLVSHYSRLRGAPSLFFYLRHTIIAPLSAPHQIAPQSAAQ